MAHAFCDLGLKACVLHLLCKVHGCQGCAPVRERLLLCLLHFYLGSAACGKQVKLWFSMLLQLGK